jgi:hypothetical protein
MPTADSILGTCYGNIRGLSLTLYSSAMLSIFGPNATGHARSRIYSKNLLLVLPTPDFSMPYNVITLTSTLIALFFGSLFNLMMREFVVDDGVPSGLRGYLILLVRVIRNGISRLKGRTRGTKGSKAN